MKSGSQGGSPDDLFIYVMKEIGRTNLYGGDMYYICQQHQQIVNVSSRMRGGKNAILG
jgi:hypothetical protein